MKILILHNDLRVYWKGRLSYLRGFLKTNGISLYAIELFGQGSPYSFDPFDDNGVWLNCLFPEKSDKQLSKKEIKKAVFSKLSQINPDIIIAGSIVFYSGALGLRWAKNNGKKFIMFDDAKPSNVKRNFLVQGIKDIITRQIDALWLPSPDYDKEYTSLYKNKNFFFFYGYNCINNQYFKPKEEKVFESKRFICVARLVPIKNIQNLLKAWKFIEDKNDVYQLTIVGDGPLYGELTGFAESLGLKRVTFTGSVPNVKLPPYLLDADAFVLPSWSESWGLVVNEAMASGLPVILSKKINAANTLLKNGYNGYSFNPDSLNELQEKLIDFINLPELAKKEMSLNSLNIINTMDYENMGRELLKTVKLLEVKPNRSSGLLADTAINLWNGRYNIESWDNI